MRQTNIAPKPESATYVVAVDVGGTCTDCVVLKQDQQVHIGKSFSTPPDFESGVIDAVRVTAKSMGLTLEELLGRTRLFLHGSTVVDNALFERKGSVTGLITTYGFEDTLLVTRGAYGRWSGQPEELIKHPTATDRPAALVPHTRIQGVSERVDASGAIVEALDEDMATAAIHALVSQGVEAIAVCLLWSFRNPSHERRIGELIRKEAPHVEVSLSCEVAPVPGEYERTSTTVINAYAVQATRSYLDSLSALLTQQGYDGSLLVMQGYGGLVPVQEAATYPVGMIECGPAAGMIGAHFIGTQLKDDNIIAADMGGTTFKVSVIRNGQLDFAREPMVDRFHYVASKLEVVSIGAGGGSIVSVEPLTRRPCIGPHSAGSRPGPICYGRGGEEPTLTDVAAIIGYMDRGTFLGGSVPLNIELAREIFAAKVARPLQMDVDQAAMGIYRVAVAQLSDAVRNVTVERGLDPRDFVLHSFGGSCGLFAGAFARELGIRRVLVPFTASVNCAYGMVAADVVHQYSVVQPTAAPVSGPKVTELLAPMARRAQQQLQAEGFAPDTIELEWTVDLRYRRQVHQVTTPLRINALPVTDEAVQTLLSDFERLYEQRYGRGSAFRAAGIDLVTFRLKASGRMARPNQPQRPVRVTDASAAKLGERKMFVEGEQTLRLTPYYDFSKLQPGDTIAGPAVVHSPITTVVVQPDQTAILDGQQNLLLETI